MRQASKRIPESAEKTVRDIRRATRRHHSAEEKIRIVLEGLRVAELCRKEGINQNLYYRWSKEFLEAGTACWHPFYISKALKQSTRASNSWTCCTRRDFALLAPFGAGRMLSGMACRSSVLLRPTRDPA